MNIPLKTCIVKTRWRQKHAQLQIDQKLSCNTAQSPVASWSYVLSSIHHLLTVTHKSKVKILMITSPCD